MAQRSDPIQRMRWRLGENNCTPNHPRLAMCQPRLSTNNLKPNASSSTLSRSLTMTSNPDWTMFLSSSRALQASSRNQGTQDDAMVAFVGHLLLLISHKASYQRLLQQRGGQAQPLIDNLQLVIPTGFYSALFAFNSDYRHYKPIVGRTPRRKRY